MDSKPSTYQVIARKYRPQTFASVVGQEAIVTTLKNALRFKRLAHAYLFCGCRGTGKTTLARVFAKALNCNNPTADLEPCNQCPSCLDVIAGRSLDVLEIDGASNRGIDDIRQINETIGYAPANGKYKIYIIDEVHMLTKEAFNALLKTLEEPPANVKFFFATTEPHKVLPTIVSRCQRFDLSRIPLEALTNKLAWIASDLNIPCEEEVFSLIAHISEGSLRDAESILDQILCCAEQPITAAKVYAALGFMPRNAFFSLDQAFEEQNLSYAFELANEIFASGKDLSYFLDTLIEHYRTLLKLKLGSPVSFFNNRQKEQTLSSATLYTQEQCLYILDYLIQWQQQIGKTPFKRVSIEMILLHLIRSKHRITLPSLARRLHELSTLPAQHQQEISPQPIKVESVPVQLQQEVLPELPKDEPAPAQAQQEVLPEPRKDEPASVQAQQEVLPEPPREEPSPAQAQQEVLPEPPKEEPSPAQAQQEVLPEPPREEPALIETKQEKPSLEETLLQKIQKKIAANSPLLTVECAEEAPQTLQQKSTPESAKDAAAVQSRYDTVMRFAAVELEGVLKKELSNG